MAAELQIACTRALSPELRHAMQRIAELMDMQVIVTGYEGDWLNFQVPQLTNGCLLADLEQRWRSAKFYDPQLQRLQILCPWGPYPQRGLFLRELDAEAQKECRAGFWYW